MSEVQAKSSVPEVDYALLNRIIYDDFGNNRENLIMMMQAIQRHYRYLPRPALDYLSEIASVPITKIYEIATFYASFSLEPKGKHILCVCTGTACHLKGSNKLIDHITTKKGISSGQTTPDMKLTLETVNCLGACAVAPVIVIDEKYHPEANLSTVIEFLEQVENEV